MAVKKSSKNNDLVFYIGLVAMLLLLVGVFSEPASLQQKVLFLIGAIVLTAVARINKQEMLFTLQIIITLGSSLAFIDVGSIIKYIVLLGAAVVGVGYLVLTKNYKNDKITFVCTIGLILIAAGMATDAKIYPLYFGLFLGFGGLLVAFYSFIDYFFNKDKIAIIWFILNLVFAVNPLMQVLSLLY
ncbi:MAG: hypothetical protein ABID61_02020 [Candidatus Micrarchaeota archaeon]